MEVSSDVIAVLEKLRDNENSRDGKFVMTLTELLMNHCTHHKILPKDILNQYVEIVSNIKCDTGIVYKVIDFIVCLRAHNILSDSHLRLIQITLEKLHQLHNISSIETSTQSMDVNVRLKYLNLQLSLLKTLTTEKSFVQMHLKDIVEGFTSCSTFFRCMTLHYKEPTHEYFELTSIFIKLSISIKTIHRLIFLITAAHYSIYTGSPKQELFERIAKEGQKMMLKSRTLVYKFTNEILDRLIAACNAKNIDISILDNLLIEFKTEKEKQNNFVTTNEKLHTKELVKPLNKMTLKEDHMSSMKGEPKELSAESQTCIQSIELLDLNNIENLAYSNKLAIAMAQNNYNHKAIVSCFDRLILKCKCVQINTKNAVLVHTLLNTIFQFFSKLKESKRLKNCSKLFFYHGNNILKQNYSESFLFWESFILCEQQLSSNPKDLEITQKRLNFISSNEIEASNYSLALHLQLIFINTTLVEKLRPSEYLALLQQNYNSCILLLSNCISAEPSLVSSITELITTESLMVAVNLALVECFEKSQIQQEEIIGMIILNQKQKLTDNGLFLYFLSKVSFLISFPISFKIGSMRFSSHSLVLDMEPLIMSHLMILQTFANTTNVLQAILKSHYLALKWLESERICSDYEYKIIETLVQTLRYHKLYNYAAELVHLFLKNREEHFSKSKLKYMLSLLLDAQFQLDQHTSCELIVSKHTNYLAEEIETLEDMEFALTVCRFKMVSHTQASQGLINKIHNAFEKKDCFNISKQKEQYAAVKLLILYARFCQVVGESTDSTNIRSVTNFGRSITILQSVFKNFLLPGSNASNLCINFKYILKMKFSCMILESYSNILQKYSSLGFAKEFNYFLGELDAFISTQPSLNLQYNYNVKLMEFNLLKNSINQATIYYERMKQLYDSIIFDDNILLEINSLVAIENYARKSNDEKLSLSATQKLDNIVFNFLKSKATTPYKYQIAITKWVEAIKRRYQYLCEGDLDDYKLAIDKNIEIYVEYHNCLKDLKEKPISGLVCYYPMVKNDLFECISDEEFRRLKACNENLLVDFHNSLNKDSVEMTRYTLNMIITSFVNMLNCNNKVQLHEELSKLALVNDSFKYASFLSEKTNSLTTFQKNIILPEITEAAFEKYQSSSLSFGLSCDLNGIIPDNWSIITIDYVPSINSLMITKQVKEFEKPLFVNLMLESSDNKNSYENITQVLKEIILESDRTTQFDVTSKIKTMDQKIKWWETRKSLDSKLQTILNDIDEHWFGGFNSIFASYKGSTEDINLVKKCIKSALSLTHIKPGIIGSVEKLHPGIFELFLNIEENISTNKVKRLLKFLFQVLDQNYTCVNETLLNKAVLQLKNGILNIVSRKKESSNGHVVLIPGNGCSNIPWESIPSLRRKSVTRMPTLQQLKNHLITYKDFIDNGISSNKGYYVINPGGDLQRTEDNLAPRFEHLDGWDGVVGAPPNEPQLMHAFDTTGLYIYAGHGGGEQFIKSKAIKARSYIPPTLLLGCSSGALKGEGFVYPYGTAYNYIMGGCPMLLVNLWDVTDKDIDTFTVETLTRWGFFVDYESLDPFDLDATNETLPESVARSRDVCKLKYLNGAAPVIYGLPLRLESN